MNAWMNANPANMSALLSEDVCAPELRNPNVSAIRNRGGWLSRLFRRNRRAS